MHRAGRSDAWHRSKVSARDVRHGGSDVWPNATTGCADARVRVGQQVGVGHHRRIGELYPIESKNLSKILKLITLVVDLVEPLRSQFTTLPVVLN